MNLIMLLGLLSLSFCGLLRCFRLLIFLFHLRKMTFLPFRCLSFVVQFRSLPQGFVFSYLLNLLLTFIVEFLCLLVFLFLRNFLVFILFSCLKLLFSSLNEFLTCVDVFKLFILRCSPTVCVSICLVSFLIWFCRFL